VNVRAIILEGNVIRWEAFAGKVNGRKMRKQFSVAKFGDVEKAKKAAEGWARDKAKQIRSQRSFGSLMDERLLSQVSEAVELLSPLRVSLVEAVRAFVASKGKDSAPEPWTFSEAASALLDNRKQRGASRRYLNDLSIQLRAFGHDFGHRQLDEITTEQIERWLTRRKLGPTTRTNWRRDLGMVWRFAILRSRSKENPAQLLARRIPKTSPVQILKVDDARKLFEALGKTQGPVAQASTLFAAIACFAGLRTSEIIRLESKNVNLETRLIEVIAKGRTRARRHVFISDNLLEFLEQNRRHSVLPVAYTPRRIRRFLAMNCSTLPPNVFRHSWFSYHLALHQNESLTQSDGGHSSSGVLFRHYREIVTKEDSASYFSIRPS
jgi:integrase